MTPAETEERSIRDYPPPPRPESPVQRIQGWYYVIVGLWVAIGITTFQSTTHPWFDLTHFWFVRTLGLVFAGVGVWLIQTAGRPIPSPLETGAAIVLPLILTVLEVTTVANDALPAPFLLDTGMEVGFLIWWALALSASHQTAPGTTPPECRISPVATSATPH